ncbi:CobW family GTP-binding protein [Kutzneria kofuensis]|uniref:G3E family GTPase n=1 Tax=Kutzneria kofuensis TaxID=103725 RepID=A0A7W9KCL5_9PSEU|nr:GTP-binding protein [Kutzneria kofuensis]MBB5889339.1 G3E family GTPase [Kutzneria kofuensis]
MARTTVPVVVLAGFLGAGKTTLLNHLLRTSSGTRIGVVVNDFGAVNIDAMAVAGQVDAMVSLSNGCVCCVTDEGGLDDVLGKLTGTVDVIVVEASGIAEPQAVARQVLGSADPSVEYGGLVEVVDAVEFAATRERHPELDKHLQVADLVVLNKVDRVDAAELAEVFAVVTELAEGGAIVTTEYGRLDPGLLFDRRERPRPAQLSFDDLEDHGATDHGEHAHALYQSVSFETDEPMHPERLMAFLDGRPDGVFRIKGYVHFGQPERYELQVVGGFLRFRRAPWGRNEPRRTSLVLIGVDMSGLEEALVSCVGEGDERAMFAVHRHTES